MSKIIKGRVWKYGDNINTDIISPGQYMSLSIEKQAKHAMEAIDSDFSKKVKPGDILVVGDNFGSGSSRETAQMVLKELGVGAIVGNFFARIFFRNSINTGLPVVEAGDTSSIDEGDVIEIHLIDGIIKNITKGFEIKATKLPEHLVEMVNAGGLVPYLSEKMGITKGG
jgi:3-isopropylmalate dehydratase small subunit